MPSILALDDDDLGTSRDCRDTHPTFRTLMVRNTLM